MRDHDDGYSVSNYEFLEEQTIGLWTKQCEKVRRQIKCIFDARSKPQMLGRIEGNNAMTEFEDI